MVNKSPAAQAKQIEQEVSSVLRKFDLTHQSASVRMNLLELKQDLEHARTYANTYELSETPEEQAGNTKRAKQWLTKANARILKASEYNIFGPVDVASLSAQIHQLIAELNNSTIDYQS